MRKTKIICTMGPATEKDGVIEALVREGMAVARFNFSHGDHEEHGNRMRILREAREKYNKPVAMLLDTKGPEIRLEQFKEDKICLHTGQLFRLYHDVTLGNEDGVSITYKDLYKDIEIGSQILI